MYIRFTRWTLIVAIVGMIVGAVASQFLLDLNDQEVALDDAVIGAMTGALLTIIGHYFPRG